MEKEGVAAFDVGGGVKGWGFWGSTGWCSSLLVSNIGDVGVVCIATGAVLSLKKEEEGSRRSDVCTNCLLRIRRRLSLCLDATPTAFSGAPGVRRRLRRLRRQRHSRRFLFSSPDSRPASVGRRRLFFRDSASHRYVLPLHRHSPAHSTLRRPFHRRHSLPPDEAHRSKRSAFLPSVRDPTPPGVPPISDQDQRAGQERMAQHRRGEALAVEGVLAFWGELELWELMAAVAGDPE